MPANIIIPGSGGGGGSGTVTSVALTSFTGITVTGSPITTSGTFALSTTISGLVKGNGSGFVAATAGTDYLTPTGNGSGLTNLNASALATGTVPQAVLGSFLGTAVTNSGWAANQIISGQLSGARGGTATDTTGVTGIAQVASGTWSFSTALPSGTTVDGTNSVGFREIPQNSKSTAYTTVLSDDGKHIYHPSADTTARTWTIDSNANVAYPLGTTLTFVNDTSAGVVTIAITSDTLVLAGAGTTGSRTLAASGIATAIKMTSTRWMISGTGLT